MNAANAALEMDDGGNVVISPLRLSKTRLPLIPALPVPSNDFNRSMPCATLP